MEKQQLIKFSVTSQEGDSEFSMLPKQALAKIKQLQKEENKWAFVGGAHVNAETLTESALIEATTKKLDIMLVTSLAGGCDNESAPEKAVEIEFDVVKKQSDITIAFEDSDYVKKITIVLGQENMIDILHDRELIYRALKRKLENLAVSQVTDLKKALKV